MVLGVEAYRRIVRLGNRSYGRVVFIPDEDKGSKTRAGILDGYEDGSFRPNASITRAEFTKIAVSFFKHVGGASSNPFNDVPDSAWYAEFVKAAAELGLIDGYEDGTFRPNAPITRAEACTIVNRTLGRAPDKAVSYTHLLGVMSVCGWDHLTFVLRQGEVSDCG